MADRSMLDAVEYFGRSMNAVRASEGQPDYTPAEILACWETMYEAEREEWRVSAEVEFISASTTINDDLVKLMVTEWAEEWIGDDGFDEAVDNAEED